MKPLARDTPLHVEQRWIAGLRARGALWRLQRLVSMTHFCWRASSDALQRARPETTPRERQAWLLQERYGPALAQRIMALDYIQRLDKEVQMPSQSELWDALLPVVEALVAMDVLYYVGGEAWVGQRPLVRYARGDTTAERQEQLTVQPAAGAALRMAASWGAAELRRSLRHPADHFCSLADTGSQTGAPSA
jgi:hypothetical protein